MRSLPLGFTAFFLAALALFVTSPVWSQPPGFGPPFGGVGGPGGFGGPNSADIALVDEFDRDNDGRLNTEERAEARKVVQDRRPGRRGRPGGFGSRSPGTPGEKIRPEDVVSYPENSLYDPSILRTLFLEFESDDWEQELADFKSTDVEVPATLTVDGAVYSDVGVKFRGASSYFMVPEGLKRSLNLSINHLNKDQRLYGYKTLNLLNCNGDPSMMSSALYTSIVGHKIATPQVNFVKVVINGECWGIYASSQQFNKVFVAEMFDTDDGARWKVPGSPHGDGGLRYLGEEIEPYRERFEIKSKDDDKSWRDLIHLCRVLDETPAAQLEEALDPILDIEGALWFLAADVALVNSDGYWTRASDYNICQAPNGKFHILPHDMNEAFHGSRRGPGGGPGGPPGLGPPGFGAPGFGPPGFGPPGFGPPGFGPPPELDARTDGPGQRLVDSGRRERPVRPQGEGRVGMDRAEPSGDRSDMAGNVRRRNVGGRGFAGRGSFGRGGPGGGGVNLDPLVGLDDPGKPLRSKLLANESLRTRYLQHVRTIADQLLSWDYLGPRVAQLRELIADEVAADTRKLTTTEVFLAATSPDPSTDDSQPSSLRAFAEKRSAYLLGHDAIKGLPKERLRVSPVSRPDSY